MKSLDRFPSLRFGLASLVVVGFVGLRDLGALSASATLLLTAAIAWLLLSLLGLEVLVGRLPVRGGFVKWLRVPAALLIVGVPLVHGVPAYLESHAALPSYTLVVLIASGAVSGVVVAFARVPLGYDREIWARATVVASALLSSLLVVVHASTSTMASVRAGTGSLHVALFAGSWIVTAGFVVLLSARFAGPPSSGEGWRALGVGVVVVVLGIALAEVDRRALVSLYEEVHVWLGLLGLLGIELGVRYALASRIGVRWIQAGFASWIVVGAVAILGLVRAGPLSEIAVRSELLAVPLGRSVIHLTPRGAQAPGPVPARHPALDFDPLLSERRNGKPLNILLVTIDAWRFDSVQPGAPDPKMPFLSGLAERSVFFTRAYAQGNRTAVAMSAIMLGRYSANLDWRLWVYSGGRIYDPSTMTSTELDALPGTAIHTTLPVFMKGRTLAERLDAIGYYTLATPYARENEFFREGVGFERGFDDFVDLTGQSWKAPSSEKVVSRAIAQQRSMPKGAPWFHWIHLYDPHESRGSAERYVERLGETDRAVERLVRTIDRRGDTVLVFVADHGEALGEHGHFSHGTSLYEEQIHVPLIIRVPGVAPRLESTPVGAIDIPATLTAMFGANTEALDGVNLWPLLGSGAHPAGRPVFSELHRYMSRKGRRTGDMKAIISGDHKLVIDRLAGTAQLFNLKSDPGEERSLLNHDRDEQARLSAILESFVGIAEAEHPLP